MIKNREEFRINKKGCECFRFSDRETAQAKLDELQQKRPGVYSMQSRHCRVNRFGVLETDLSHKECWTPWR